MTRAALTALALAACTATHEEAPQAASEPEVAPTAPSVEPGGDGQVPAVIPELPPPDETTQTPVVEQDPSRFATPSAWHSAACEGRAYERQITFTDGHWAAVDLVSPCPPDVVCVWSGIIDRTGTWTLDRKQLRLTVDDNAAEEPQASKFPMPEHLWLGADGTLTEDEGNCPYTLATDE